MIQTNAWSNNNRKFYDIYDHFPKTYPFGKFLTIYTIATTKNKY